MPRPYPYPSDYPHHCADCGRPCTGERCGPCSREWARGRPKRGVPVKAPDGREWPSVTALAREWGTSHQAAYNHMVWNGDHWLLLREPAPTNIGRRRDRHPARARETRYAAD
jgi:hypothetical protein